MDAQKIAARFVAFTAFLNQRKQPVLLEHAGRYARRHWKKYLPYASENLAHFLTKRPRGCKDERPKNATVLRSLTFPVRQPHPCARPGS
jgi:hypothetical protein